MLRRVSATPCPVPALDDITSRRDSIFDTTTTTNLDFTTDLSQANLLTGVKPRRRQTNIRRDVAIYEDESQRDSRQLIGTNAYFGASLLSRPAKRLRGRVSFAGDAKTAGLENVQPTRMPLGSIAEMEHRATTGSHEGIMVQPPRRRISTVGPGILKQEQHEPTMTFTLDRTIQDDRTLAKPPRRGTIYIPPDDTTMPSMYMGIFSPVKKVEDDMEKLDEELNVNVTGIAAEIAKRRGRRSSLAAEPARRIGLTRSALGVIKEQDSSFKANVRQDVDRAGTGVGKENVPPGFHQRNSASDANCTRDHKPAFRISASHANPVQRRQTAFGASASASVCPQPEQRKPAWNAGATMKASKINSRASTPAFNMQGARREPKVPTQLSKVPSKFTLPRVNPEKPLSHQFPLLSEDLGNPAMYEDSWLNHQEIAITQLLNNLLASASSREPGDADLLRIDLLDLYQTSQFVLLYRRLQGAILHGALRVPENLLLDADRIQNDLGIRRSFADLWTRTYERDALKAALEVVVGRRCSSTSKDIRTFIEVFLIRNEDARLEATGTNHAVWSYRRTILRSLMLIKLLDHAKTMVNTTLTAPLFLATSQYKTSLGVLQALTQLLNPSMGQRALGHLEYSVEHKQHALEEYDYPVANLAVDLRDGVRLTRLVELLLYPCASRQLARESPEDTTMTLNMPTGEVLSMLDNESPTKSTQYPLSQHLKFPCEGRAVKIFNVQIAISALQQVKSIRSIVEGISAEDVVDGFREKTVAMLWGLTGKWGLGGLIDWKDVRSEIVRFQRRKDTDNSDMLDDEELEDLSHSFTGYKALLKAWAAGVASSKGLKVKNLTTSFADGQVFEAIVEEYETYLPPRNSSPTYKKVLLHERLAKLGCSSQFSSLFVPSLSGNKYQIFDREFTLAALAFLCSRLLSTSKRARASVIIQRAWRRYQLREEARKQKMASMLANQCAEVVSTRERLLRSKLTILKAWRSCKASRQRKWAEDRHDHDDTNLETGDLWLTL